MTKSTINKRLLIPTILVAVTYFFSYGIPSFFVSHKVIYITSKVDELIPLFTPAVIPYILALFQWIAALYIVLKQDTNKGYYLCSSLILSSLIGMIIFFIFPTQVIRPTLQIANIFDQLLSNVYASDVGFAFPSFHCLFSWFVIRALKKCNNVSKSFYIVNVLFSFMVFASTLLVKQHVIYDVFGGILLCELGMYIATKIKIDGLFNYLNKHILNIK